MSGSGRIGASAAIDGGVADRRSRKRASVDWLYGSRFSRCHGMTLGEQTQHSRSYDVPNACERFANACDMHNTLDRTLRTLRTLARLLSNNEEKRGCQSGQTTATASRTHACRRWLREDGDDPTPIAILSVVVHSVGQFEGGCSITSTGPACAIQALPRPWTRDRAANACAPRIQSSEPCRAIIITQPSVN